MDEKSAWKAREKTREISFRSCLEKLVKDTKEDTRDVEKIIKKEL